MRVLVCKNDGCFELEPAELRGVESWSDVKMGLARALYSEEELFAVGSADDIALYTFPDGSSAEELEGQVYSLVEPDSRWVLDIFGSPFRQRSDLNLQTDHAIRGVRRVSATPFQPMEIRRASALHGVPASSMPISPLGNAAHGGFHHETSEEQGSYHEPYIHIGTWVPVMLKEKKSISLRPTAQYEDVLVTTNRAREYINNFRRAGRPVTILSIQTCTLPLAAACPSAISQQGPQILYEGVYHLNPDEMQRGFVQTVRLWFSFDCEQTISVTKVNGALGLKPLRQQDGWIVVQALPGSPCFEAGMRRDEVFLTHVNGVDVSPHSFPAVGTGAPPQQGQDTQAQPNKKTGQVTWQDSVVPLVEKWETCIFTFF